MNAWQTDLPPLSAMKAQMMDRWMDGWQTDLLDEWMDDGWIINGCMDSSMDVWMDGRPTLPQRASCVSAAVRH